jgi:hypothetical protein
MYLLADLNSQWPIAESARIQTITAVRQNTMTTHKHKKEKAKIDHLRLFIFEHEFLKNICRFKNCIYSRNTSS